MRLGIPTPAARPAPATTEPFRNSRRVTAMTSPFLCAVGAALRASVRRRSDGGCGPARSRAGSVAAPPTDDVVRSAPGRGASDVPRLIPGNSGHYEEDGLDDCLFGRHIAGDRLRHEQRPGDVGHGAATVHRGPSEPLERRLLTEVVAPHQRALGPLDHRLRVATPRRLAGDFPARRPDGSAQRRARALVIVDDGNPPAWSLAHTADSGQA